MSEQMRNLERTRMGRLKAKHEILTKRNPLPHKHKLFREMRATSGKYLNPDKYKKSIDPRDGWLARLKRKFSKSYFQNNTLKQLFEDEFDELDYIG